MKKRLFISVALALLLTVLGSVPVLAAKPESPVVASGFITFISPGIPYENVFPAGNSGRWRVIDRVIGGQFVDSDIGDSFTLTYKANVDETQAGILHGTLEVGSYVLQVNGKIEPLPLPELAIISGHWTVIEGARGQGDFEAYIVLIIENGHVVGVEGTFELTGKWK